MNKFALEYNIDLGSSLEAIGMSQAFTSHADFRKMSSPPGRLSKVIHKTILEVDEDGTTAAAVTMPELRSLIGGRWEPFTMIVDHPFFCAIQDRETGEILFMGSVLEPGEIR